MFLSCLLVNANCTTGREAALGKCGWKRYLSTRSNFCYENFQWFSPDSGHADKLLFTQGEDHLQLDHDSEFMPKISLDDSLRRSTWGRRLAMEKKGRWHLWLFPNKSQKNSNKLSKKRVDYCLELDGECFQLCRQRSVLDSYRKPVEELQSGRFGKIEKLCTPVARVVWHTVEGLSECSSAILPWPG